VADFALKIDDPRLRAEIERAIDQEGKIPRALDALGPVAGRQVVLLDADRGVRAAQLAALGAEVTAVQAATTAELAPQSTEVVVSCWAGFRGGAPDSEQQVADAGRVLRPGGRLLIVHDYGRDDVSGLLDGDPATREELAWSRRDGWFLLNGFKLRVLHCWWTFPSLEEAQDLLQQAYGDTGAAVAQQMRRPRLEYKVAVYHRSFGEAA